MRRLNLDLPATKFSSRMRGSQLSVGFLMHRAFLSHSNSFTPRTHYQPQLSIQQSARAYIPEMSLGMELKGLGKKEHLDGPYIPLKK